MKRVFRVYDQNGTTLLEDDVRFEFEKFNDIEVEEIMNKLHGYIHPENYNKLIELREVDFGNRVELSVGFNKFVLRPTGEKKY